MAQTLKIVVTNPVGLFATPTTELVNTVKQFQSQVTLEYGNKTVNLKSMMGVLSLGIPTKAELTIVVEGEDEISAIKTIHEKCIELDITDK